MRSSLRSPARTAFVAGALALLTFGSGAQAAPAGASLRDVAQSVHTVGSGTLNWTVAVRAKPSRSSKRLTVLKEFRSEYRPQFVLVFSILLALGTWVLRTLTMREHPDAADQPASTPFAHAWRALRR